MRLEVRRTMKHVWVWIAAVAIIAGAVVLAFYARPHSRGGLQATQFAENPSHPGHPGAVQAGESSGVEVEIVPQNAPVVTRFIGDLEVKGNKENDGTVAPFVVGEVLRLEAEALNAVEYRWTCNGEVLKEKGLEWGRKAQREYEVMRPGPYVFALQVRGGEASLVSQEKSTQITILPLKIMSLEKSLVHDDDQRFITGEEITLNVNMATAVGVDPDFYRFRYFVNDVPVKGDDGEEWSTDDSLTYAFTAPGSYTFKVEARRTTEKQAEESMELPEPVICADAVLLSFDSIPDREKGAGVGALVNFNAFPVSRFGQSECRFGIKKINAADYAWVEEEDGSIWGDFIRNWVPTEAGTYLVRCEIREVGKQKADDYREIYYTVTDGNF